ncbi:MAG: GNAT family N-acetyltransferase [Candidatus Planktophila sp.]
MHQPVILTERLELHHLPVQGIIDLLEKKDDSAAIAERNFINPHRVLVDESGPLGWRVPQVKTDPSLNKWFVRSIVLASNREIIGSTSFHGAPDKNGMMEIGLGIEEGFRGKGYAKEALLGMWRWVCVFPEVKTLRYTVSPENIPSIAVIKYFGFIYMGQQMDEIDGPEDIYELNADVFAKKWGAKE